jgi:transcriptional regulator with XRE-family HTH domain
MRESLEEFRHFLEAAARRYPSKQALARAIGITPGRLSRVLKGEHSLDVINCLRLAQLTGDAPGDVLRVAGKQDVAELLAALYGEAPTLSPADREVLEAWRTLNLYQRELLRALIDDMAVTHHGERPRRDVPKRAVHVLKPTAPAGSVVTAARRDATQGGQEFVGTLTDGEATVVSRAQRARESKEAAAIDRLTRAAEQAESVDRPVVVGRAVGQHAATARARSSARRPRVGKHRR